MARVSILILIVCDAVACTAPAPAPRQLLLLHTAKKSCWSIPWDGCAASTTARCRSTVDRLIEDIATVRAERRAPGA